MAPPVIAVVVVALLAVLGLAYLRGVGRRGPVTVTGEIHYLALGDSYTIGTALTPAKSFPPRLARHLEATTGKRIGVVNLGVNGYTTEDLIRDELPHLGDAHWDVVTLLIGVNDFVQGRSEAQYRTSLRSVLERLQALGLPEGRVVLVSVPDFSYTPTGSSFGRPAEIEAGLRRFNSIAREEAARTRLAFVDIFEVSRSQIGSPGWVAPDGLHPGEAQLQAWADRVWSAAQPSWSAAGR